MSARSAAQIGDAAEVPPMVVQPSDSAVAFGPPPTGGGLGVAPVGPALKMVMP